LVFVGKVTRPHGVRGELKVLEGLDCSGTWRNAAEVHIGADPESAERWQVRRVRGSGKFAILSLADLDHVDRAETLREKNVYVDRAELPAPEEGEYYAEELIGFDVVDTAGRRLGELKEIFDNGAHEVYVVGRPAGDLLLPVIDGVVVTVDPEAGQIEIEPPPGLPGLED
jgi:16S rRNA processing protein RimM